MMMRPSAFSKMLSDNHSIQDLAKRTQIAFQTLLRNRSKHAARGIRSSWAVSAEASEVLVYPSISRSSPFLFSISLLYFGSCTEYMQGTASFSAILPTMQMIAWSRQARQVLGDQHQALNFCYERLVCHRLQIDSLGCSGLSEGHAPTTLLARWGGRRNL